MLLGEFETPIIECPRCGAPYEDHDGFGVVYCSICGYCQHLSSSGDICDYCGKSTSTPPLPIRPYHSRKHETAKALLTEQYGPSAQYYGDRAWCYAKLAELGYWWDVTALVWVLHPELNEVGAQGYAWELITSVKMEDGV